MASFLVFSIISVLSLTRAQDRAPHGIAYENPVAFSPSAFDFFHPDTQQPSSENPCGASNCSPLPLAATVQSSPGHESRSKPNAGESRMGAGGIAGILFGFVFAMLLALGVYYVVITRRANMCRTDSVQPEA